MTERKARILIVEDDETIALGVQTALQHEGHEVRHHDRAETALDELERWRPDLLVLDRMLPGVDGLTVLRYIRDQDADLKVILLTAKGTESDRVEGLDAGADDYVTKPFSLKELLARVRARLRDVDTSASEPGDLVKCGECAIDLRRRVVHRAGEEIRLTTHEAGVLAYLILHSGKDVTRDELLEHVWGYATNMITRTVDNQILKLRKKIELVPADPRHILTVHGVGYRFEP